MIGSNNNVVIASVIASFTQQNESLIKSLQSLQYYFRGAYGRDDMWAMSYLEREVAIEFINVRFKEAGDLMKKHITVFL